MYNEFVANKSPNPSSLYLSLQRFLPVALMSSSWAYPPPPPPPPASHLPRAPSLPNPFFLTRSSYKQCRSGKFPGGRLSLTSPSSTIRDSTGPAAPSHSPSLDHIEDRICPKRKGISLADEYIDDETSSKVDSFLQAIGGALPSKNERDLLGAFMKDGQIWNISDFNDLLTALAVANEHDMALKLFYGLSSYSLVPDSRTFSIVIRCHCKKNNGDEARRILDHMLEKGLNPDVATFTTLISALCKRGKLKKALQVFGIMNRIECCRPTVQTYNCLLKGLCYVGRVEEAFELLAGIKKASIEPDIYTYTAMMDGFCKVGRSDEAMELLNEALEMGLTPTVVTFNTLLEGYTKEGRPSLGIGVLKRMKQTNCMPDYISYSTLLHGLLIWGQIQAALHIYKEMSSDGFGVEDRLMNRLLRGLCRQSLEENCLLQDAYKVFEEMKQRVSVIDHSTYGLVIQALCLGKQIDKAVENLEQMFKLGNIPRVITIERLVHALCVEGKVNKAIRVLILMYENHRLPSRMSYDPLIQELNRQGRSTAACNVYGAALIRGVIPRRKPQH